jgi:hypothetical protein
MTTPLRERPTEELRQEIRDALHSIAGDLLTAAQAAHAADRVSDMNLKWIAGLGEELDRIGDNMRSASDNFRKVQSAVEVLSERAKAQR